MHSGGHYYCYGFTYGCTCDECRRKRWQVNLPPTPGLTIQYLKNKEGEEMNVNLNLFLKILGATNEIIDDDQKTLEFMFEVKRKLEEFDASKQNNTGFITNE